MQSTNIKNTFLIKERIFYFFIAKNQVLALTNKWKRNIMLTESNFRKREEKIWYQKH